MTCRIIVWVRDGALRPTAVDRPWTSCSFQTGNSCTSSFLSGRFLHKIMLQKARRGKEINRGVVDQPFSHLYFSAKMKNAKGCMGFGVRSYMHTVLVTNNEPSNQTPFFFLSDKCELTAGSDEKNTAQPRRGSSCAVFFYRLIQLSVHICRIEKRKEFD